MSDASNVVPMTGRRLPWTGPHGEPEYAAPGEVDAFADREEEHTISMARNDALYALSRAELSGVSPDELRELVRNLASAVASVARVADLREERLKDPAYGPAVRSVEAALRKALRAR